MTLFRSLAVFSERFAWLIVGAWLVAAVVLGAMAPSLNEVGTPDTASFLPAHAPSQQADRVISELFPDDPSREAAVIVMARDGGLTEQDRSFIDGVGRYLESPEAEETYGQVQSTFNEPDLAPFLQSPDGEAELIVASLEFGPFSTSANDAIGDLRDRLRTQSPEGLSVNVSGIGGLAADQADALIESFDRTAIISVLLVLLILIWVYRSAVAPLIALATIGIAFLVAQGAIAYLAEAGFEVSSMVATFMVVMAFGAGTDYCLFIVSRYREELAAGEPVPATVRRAMTIIGAVIAASAGTVIVGFLSMTTAQFGIYRTMGPAIGIAILVTLAASLTLTPALLQVCGHRAFWPQALDTVRAQGADSSPRWERVGALVRRRPVVLLVMCTVGLAAPATALTQHTASFDLINDLPPDADARQGFSTLERHFPGGTISPVYVVVRDDQPILDDGRTDAIDELTDALRSVPGVAEVRSLTQPAGEPLTPENLEELAGSANLANLGLEPDDPTTQQLLADLESDEGLRLSASLLHSAPGLQERLAPLAGEDGRSTRLIIALEGNPYENDALDVFEHIDDETASALEATDLADASVSVGGPTAFYADMRTIGERDFKVLSVVLLVAIFVVLALLLRSLVAPLYLLATVVLSYAATMGIAVIVFQGILDDPGITFWLAPFLFVVLVALGADYNIFIMSRIREEAEAGHSVAEATHRGLVLTGRIITSAGLILAGTFAALMLAPLPNLRQIGFGVTVGILIDTFIVRSLLLPSITILLHRWAFWPNTPGTDRPAEPTRRQDPGTSEDQILVGATASRRQRPHS